MPAVSLRIMSFAVVILAGSVCAAQSQGDRAAVPVADDQLKLVIRTAPTDPKPENTTLVSLADSRPQPLTEAESAAADRAMERLYASCSQDEEVPAILVGAAPEGALEHFAKVFPAASAAVQRAMAVQAARLDGPAASSVVAMALMSDEVGPAAKSALDARGKPVPADALLAALRVSPSQKQILTGLGYLGAAGDDSLVAPLRVWVSHKSPEVRARAVSRLAAIGSPAVLGDLRSALGDPAGNVREAALWGLKAQSVLTDQDLVAALEGADSAAQAAVLDLVRGTTDPALVAFVTETAADQTSKQWATALKASARLGDPGMVASLVALLASPQKDVRMAAVTALGAHPRLTDFAPLVRAAKDDAEADVASAAARALVSAGAGGISAALAGLSPADKGWDALVTAVTGQGDAAAEAILSIARVQPSTRNWLEIGRACAAVKPPTRYALSAAVLERGGGYGQAKAISALQDDASPEAIATLASACDCPGVLATKEVDSTWNLQLGGGGTVNISSQDVSADIWRLLLDALEALDKGAAQAAREHLISVALASLASENVEARAGGLTTLAHLAATRESEAIRDAVKRLSTDPDKMLRKAAAEAAALVGGDDLWAVVQTLLTDQYWATRMAAMGAVLKYPEHIDVFTAAAGKAVTDHADEERAMGFFAQLPAPLARSALAALATHATRENLAVKAIAEMWTRTASGVMNADEMAADLAPLLKGPVTRVGLVALCAVASQGSPDGLARLLEVGPSAPSGPEIYWLRQFTVGADYGGQAGGGPIAAGRARSVGRLSFERGYEGNYFANTTYLFGVPVAVARKADRFAPGDRWPLDLVKAPPARSTNAALIAAAGYDDPRADALIQAAATGTNGEQRISAAWALAMRDDREALERMLNDADATVRAQVVSALRLLGHRSSVLALAPWVDSDSDAAKAVVELTLFQDTVAN